MGASLGNLGHCRSLTAGDSIGANSGLSLKQAVIPNGEEEKESAVACGS